MADIEARSIQDDDPQRAAAIRQVADIKARGEMARANIAKGGAATGGIGSALARLMAGGGVAALTGADTGSNVVAGNVAPTGGTLTAEVQTMKQDAGGTWWVQFKPLMIPQPSIANAAKGYAR